MWTPQHYISQGLVQGLDKNLLERAANQIDELVSYRKVPAILTLNHLAKRIGVNFLYLRGVVDRSDNTIYRHFRIRKRSGGSRPISVPNPKLMSVQRWLANYVLRNVKAHNASYAFSPENSIAKCAARHCGARWLVKMDVSDFFGSISEIQVFKVFSSLGYQPLIAFELARLCTYVPKQSLKYKLASWKVWRKTRVIKPYESQVLGRLPQGAPTSPMLSNLAMIEIDTKISALARDLGLIYTRYSDDLTFSTRSTEFDRAAAGILITKVSKLLKSEGLFPKKSKTVIIPPGARKVVLGLIVDADRPRLPREFKSKLRQHLYYLEKFGPAEHANFRDWETISGLYRHLRGLIDFANMVEPIYATEMLGKLDKVSWPK